jgi:hypothetical protein
MATPVAKALTLVKPEVSLPIVAATAARARRRQMARFYNSYSGELTSPERVMHGITGRDGGQDGDARARCPARTPCRTASR